MPMRALKPSESQEPAPSSPAPEREREPEPREPERAPERREPEREPERREPEPRQPEHMTAALLPCTSGYHPKPAPAPHDAARSPIFQQLAQFFTKQMCMSHLYQPLMLRTLIGKDGYASLRDIAHAG